MKNQWIEISIPALLYRDELPEMTKEQEQVFCSSLSKLLGEYLPTGQDWIDVVEETLSRSGIKETRQ